MASSLCYRYWKSVSSYAVAQRCLTEIPFSALAIIVTQRLKSWAERSKSYLGRTHPRLSFRALRGISTATHFHKRWMEILTIEMPRQPCHAPPYARSAPQIPGLRTAPLLRLQYPPHIRSGSASAQDRVGLLCLCEPFDTRMLSIRYSGQVRRMSAAIY